MTANNQVAEASVKYLAEVAGQTVTTGYKKTEMGLIPEDWALLSLDQIACPNGLVRGPFGGAIKKEYFVKNGYKVYEQRNAIYANVEAGNYFIDQNKYQELKRFSVKIGDFIVSCSGTIGKIFQIPDFAPEGVINQALLKITIKDSLNSQYFLHFFRWEKFQEKIIDGTQGGAMKNLVGMAEFKKSIMLIPAGLEEQAAIANALSDVDALISELEKLIAKKQDIKTATMQQLLTGRTRLPQFARREDGTPKGYKSSEFGNIPDDWSLSTIGAHTTWMSGGTPNRNNEEFWNGSIPWISGSTLKSFEISTSNQFLSEEAVTAGSKMAPIGAVLFLVRGSALHNEIRAGMVVAPVAFNQDVKALIPTKGLDSRFLTFFFLAMESELLKLVSSAGNSAGVLDTELIKNFKLFLPLQHEQTAIATILTDMDEEIQTLQKRLAKTRQIKQGMMQELLTGKTRLVKPALKEFANV
jgi:restriction endonuclease S subunit